MRSPKSRFALVYLVIFAVGLTSCTDEFHLSESETAAYANMIRTATSANQLCDALEGDALEIEFDSSGSTPRVSRSNLLDLMRRTDLVLVEASNQARLERLSRELETQINEFVEEHLQVMTGEADSQVKLARLDRITLRFLADPTFDYHLDRTAISYNLRVAIKIEGTLKIRAFDGFLRWLFGSALDVSYPLQVDLSDYTLSGEVTLDSRFANSAQIRLHLTPIVGAVQVSDTGSSVAPSVVKSGVRRVFETQLAKPVDATFNQQYDYFALSHISMFPNSQAETELLVDYENRPKPAATVLHVVSRSATGLLYHARKDGDPSLRTHWRDYNESVFPAVGPYSANVQSDPAMVVSGADNLELAATTTTGEIAYANWNSHAWRNRQIIARGPTQGFSGKPALVASAPGQLEIVVQGQDGRLWHVRRLNGNWTTPTLVPLSIYSSHITPPFRDPVAVQSGNQLVLTFVDGQNRLRAIPFDLETASWGSAAFIQTSELINFAPATVASGDGRVDVVYVGQSGVPYHRRFGPLTNGLVIGPENSISGSLTATPALICSGYHRLELLGRGTDNKLWHNHYVTATADTSGWIHDREVRPGWQGWGDLNGFFSGTVSLTQRMEEFSAVSTQTGILELVSRSSPSTFDSNQSQYVFHNSYDATRFGRDAWNVVHWRGTQRFSDMRFVGRPAIAVMDQNLEVAFVGSNALIKHARLNDRNEGQFTEINSAPVKISPNPVDPVILASGHGIVDLLYLGSDGRPRHVRRPQLNISWTSTLTVPSGVTLGSELSAVSFGNGQIELIAVGDNRSMYHWRYRNGTWTAATQLTGTVISVPILKYTGAGQLEVLAVGGDQKLYRWQHRAGSWSSWQQIPSSFKINQILFTSRSAASWGDGTVDLVVVAAETGKLFHRRIGPRDDVNFVPGGLPTRDFQEIGGNIMDTPLLSAMNPTRLSVIAMGTDGLLYSNSAERDMTPIQQLGADPPLRWQGFGQIGWSGLLPGGVTNFAGGLSTIAVDSEGRVFLDRTFANSWKGYQKILGQSPGMRLSPPLFRPAIAAYGG